MDLLFAAFLIELAAITVGLIVASAVREAAREVSLSIYHVGRRLEASVQYAVRGERPFECEECERTGGPE